MREVDQYPSSSALARERMRTGSVPLKRNEPYKFGLILPGGGMGSGYLLGMVLALGRSHFTRVFDSVYAISAGSVAAAYLLARQPEAIHIFYEDVNNSDFINKSRRPIVDIEYLKSVMKKKRPLIWERVAENPITLNICISAVTKTAVKTVIHNSFQTQDELINAIGWSCRIPFAAGDPYPMGNGTYYTDGVVATGGMCMKEAINDGCTHLMILQPHPDGFGERTVPSAKFETIAALMLFKKHPVLAQAIMNINVRYAQSLRAIKRAEKYPECSPVRIKGMRVASQYKTPDILEKNPVILKKSTVVGYTTGMTEFANMLSG